MECDIIFNIGGKEEKLIKREDSPQDLSSLSDISSFIQQNWNAVKRNSFIRKLQNSSSLLNASEQLWLGKPIIGNTTVEYIKYLYPEAGEILDKIPDMKPYNITLINSAFSNGKSLKGRVIGNGVVTNVIRNRYDAEKFARTEYTRYMASQLLQGDDIDKENPKNSKYLTDKYKEKLMRIKKSHARKIKEHIKERIPKFDGEITLKHLINDFLDYKNDYLDINNGVDEVSVLNDFCRELLYLPIYNSDTESELARRLRSLHYKREEFGKLELYEAIEQLGTEEQKKLLQETGRQQFVDMTLEDMQKLMTSLFQDDVTLSRYQVISVEKTNEQRVFLTEDQINQLLQNKNENLEKSKKVKREDLNDIEGIKEFFGEDFTITVDNKTYKIDLIQDGDKIRYYYYKTKLTNNSKIQFKYKGKTLASEFGIGRDTMKLIVPVEEEGITDGQYMGMYIYKYKPNKGSAIYFVSKSVLHPDLYNISKFSSLKDAKQAAEGYVRAANIEKETNIKIKQEIDIPQGRDVRSVLLKHKVTPGSAISSIYYPIKKSTKLKSQEYRLFTKEPMHVIQEFYQNTFGINLTSLDTPEKIGTFLYAMTEADLTIENLQKELDTSKTLSKKTKDEVDRVINSFDDVKVHQFLVEKYENRNEGTLVYLKSLLDHEVNSTGFVPDQGLPSEFVKRKSLHTLQTLLNEGLFKGTSVEVLIQSKQDIAQLKTEDGKSLFPDVSVLDSVRGFVHNNKIYIVTENADVHDLMHETLHITLGAFKADNYKLYEYLVNYFYKLIPESQKNIVNTRYENFALMDRKEETVVRYLASMISNNSQFFDVRQITDLDSLIFKEFRGLSGTIKKAINKVTDTADGNTFDFKSRLQILLSSDDSLSNMQKHRIATNIIEKGIRDKKILKGDNC